MNTLLSMLLVIVGVVALIFIIASFSRKIYKGSAHVIINAPRQTVFDYVKEIRNQDFYSKWVMKEPSMGKTFTGTDGTVGFIYAWNGTKAGEGEQEITAIEEGKSISTEIRFVRPMTGVAHTVMTTEAVSENQTKVTWSNEGTMKYPVNIMVPMLEKMMTKDMDFSLNTLKRILEK